MCLILKCKRHFRRDIPITLYRASETTSLQFTTHWGRRLFRYPQQEMKTEQSKCHHTLYKTDQWWSITHRQNSKLFLRADEALCDLAQPTSSVTNLLYLPILTSSKTVLWILYIFPSSGPTHVLLRISPFLMVSIALPNPPTGFNLPDLFL